MVETISAFRQKQAEKDKTSYDITIFWNFSVEISPFICITTRITGFSNRQGNKDGPV